MVAQTHMDPESDVETPTAVPVAMPPLRLNVSPAAVSSSPFGTSLDLLGRVGSVSPAAMRARNRSIAMATPVFQRQLRLHSETDESKLMRPLLQSPINVPVVDLDNDPHRSTFTQTTFNSINVLCGLGLLSYPFALQCSGWSGLLVLVGLTFITLYTAAIIGTCMKTRPHIHTLPDIGLEAFGRPMAIFIGIIFFIELFLAGNVAYLLVESDNLHKLFPSVSRPIFLILATLVVLPTTWLNDLAVLSYLSAFGVFSSLSLMLAILYTATTSYGSDTVTFKLSTFPQSVGLLLIGFGGHAIFPNIYASMKSPKRYRSMLSTTYVVVFLIYALSAGLGYVTFGENTKKEITLNLSNGPVAEVAVWIVIANPLCKFALTLRPIVVQAQSIFPTRYHSPKNRAIISTLLTMCALGTALIIPMFDRLLEFTGSLCTSTVSLTYPALCYLKLCGSKLSRLEYAFSTFIVVLGISLSVAGTASSIYGPLPFQFIVP